MGNTDRNRNWTLCPLVALARFLQGSEKLLEIRVAAKDGLAVVAAIERVIHRAIVNQSGKSWHATHSNMIRARPQQKDELTPIWLPLANNHNDGIRNPLCRHLLYEPRHACQGLNWG